MVMGSVSATGVEAISAYTNSTPPASTRSRARAIASWRSRWRPLTSMTS